MNRDFGWNCWKNQAKPRLKPAALRREAEEILAMTVASIKTLRAKSAANPKSKI